MSIADAAASTNDNDVSLGPIDCTGVKTLFLAVADVVGTGGDPSDGVNVYTLDVDAGGVGAPKVRVYHCLNPDVSAPLTFTYSASTGYPSLAIFGDADEWTVTDDSTDSNTGQDAIEEDVSAPANGLVISVLGKNQPDEPTPSLGWTREAYAPSSDHAYGIAIATLSTSGASTVTAHWDWTPSGLTGATLAVESLQRVQKRFVLSSG